MEVHHHSHSSRKKWTHYFWEFLMLFLAVFCGFWAEYQLEHKIERDRAKEFAKTMLTDLHEDTVQLNMLIKRWSYAAASVDSFITIVAKETIKDVPSGKLYWYGLWGGFLHSFISNDATFQQMKHSGSLRYITNKELSKAISLYDWQTRKIYGYMAIDQPMYTETRKARSAIFDFKYNIIANEIAQALYISMSQGTLFDQPRLDSFKNSNPPLLTYDKATLNQYAEMSRSRPLGPITSNLKVALSLAEEIITIIKKEYHLK